MKEFEISSEQALEINNSIQKIQSKYFSKKNNNKICMYSNCNNTAINSHAISKEQSLRIISEYGKVFTFESKRQKEQINGKTLGLELIGINDASAFKGFCIEHDKCFDILDSSSIKNSVQDILLQAYRSICFSLFNARFLEAQQEHSERLLYDTFTADKIREHLELDPEQGNQISDDILLSCFESIHREHSCKWVLESKLLLHFKKEIQNYISLCSGALRIPEKQNEFIFYNDSCSICIMYQKIDLKIHVGMLNHHLLKIREKPHAFLFTVVPHSDGTELFWVFEKECYPILEAKWRVMLCKNISIINGIESSMMHCENWYINPSIIRTIPTERMQIIKEDMYFNNERSPFDEYDLSIFDDLRKEAIKSEDDIVKERELKKMKLPVIREPYLKRLERYNQDVFDSL